MLVGVIVDEPLYLPEAQAACFCDTVGLESGVGDGDVRVEARARCGHGIDGTWCVRSRPFDVAVGVDALGDGGQELGVGRSEVGCAGRNEAQIGGIGRHELARRLVAVVEDLDERAGGCGAGRRRPGVEVLV